jgi:hypothetical protein
MRKPPGISAFTNLFCEECEWQSVLESLSAGAYVGFLFPCYFDPIFRKTASAALPWLAWRFKKPVPDPVSSRSGMAHTGASGWETWAMQDKEAQQRVWAATELRRDQAEEQRNAAEDQWAFSEEVRDSSEGHREDREHSRETAETTRRAAEEIRAGAEMVRQSAEQARILTDEIRQIHEQARQAAEEIRRDAEEWRATLAEEREIAAEMNETLRAWREAHN